ncbi:uncharacterized protein A4U43_C07F9590 [Asparagus officinalis]|uniref:Uncharacterized protein n=1 Tax=Asparagus officinalis TaxID=4686 RepID=A0A5P1EDQ0_ASPOF|nr:uncharacterized protein A4U43_C07F9590 [Asparagus officinalis]
MTSRQFDREERRDSAPVWILSVADSQLRRSSVVGGVAMRSRGLSLRGSGQACEGALPQLLAGTRSVYSAAVGGGVRKGTRVGAVGDSGRRIGVAAGGWMQPLRTARPVLPVRFMMRPAEAGDVGWSEGLRVGGALGHGGRVARRATSSG